MEYGYSKKDFLKEISNALLYSLSIGMKHRLMSSFSLNIGFFTLYTGLRNVLLDWS